jgi:hypothetical protein
LPPDVKYVLALYPAGGTRFQVLIHRHGETDDNKTAFAENPLPESPSGSLAHQPSTKGD